MFLALGLGLDSALGGHTACRSGRRLYGHNALGSRTVD